MRQIVCNTGPPLHLLEIGALELLEPTGDVQIPPAVDWELAQSEPDWPRVRPDWMHVAALEPAFASEAERLLRAGIVHGGEAAAIALARQIHADWLLTDDAAARLLAQTLGLEVHGSLGMVLWAAAAGHRNRIQTEDLLSKLARSSLWISPRILAEAKAALDMIFSR